MQTQLQQATTLQARKILRAACKQHNVPVDYRTYTDKCKTNTNKYVVFPLNIVYNIADVADAVNTANAAFQAQGFANKVVHTQSTTNYTPLNYLRVTCVV